MEEEVLIQLITEVRSEYHIPPYFSEDSLKNFAIEGEAYLLGLNPGRDVNEDRIYRMLLKNYINYAFYSRTNEFRENYKQIILGWQLNTEV